MNNKLLLLFFITLNFLLCDFLFAQSPGDTIRVKAYDYTSKPWRGRSYSRDTLVNFPNNPSVTYEKILLLYNLRCQNGIVNTRGGNDVGCGAWDYNCQTYIHDSTRLDSLIKYTNNYYISNFDGSTFKYKRSPLYNYYNYTQKKTSISSTTGETISSVGSGTLPLSRTLITNSNSGKSYYLYTATELTSAGVTAGNIDALSLDFLSNNTTAHFLKIKMKATSLANLASFNGIDTGFIEVYNRTIPLALGIQKFHFYNSFAWNGTSNIIVEFSTTNSGIPSSSLSTVKSHTTNNVSELYNDSGNCVVFNGSGFLKLNEASFSNITDKITISFWSFGDSNILPKSTSILEGLDTNNNRSVNIHLPWENSTIYWDCGMNANGSVDRIEKATSSKSEYAGKWNYWTFTKNAQTGEMKIYLNGIIWASGGNKNGLINIKQFNLGNSVENDYYYFGKIAHFSVFNTELAISDIQALMYRKITPTYSNYNHLVAYYPFVEKSSSSSIKDYSSNNQSLSFKQGFNGHLGYIKGDEIALGFLTGNKRPNVSFYQGTYTTTNSDSTVKDSLLVLPNLVRPFFIVKKTGLNNDSVAYNSSQDSLFWDVTSGIKTYDQNNTLISTVPISTYDSILITQLSYQERNAMKYQLLSFVTPYGINLDLGPNGKTWTFDITDFTPVLKGKKRITIEGGGQWQEDMDITFLFIVGTPPRNVVDISPIWRPSSSSGYKDILSEKVFPPRDVLLPSQGKFFKTKTVITGHGQQGEFIPRNHFLDVGSGSNKKRMQWRVWKACSENPLYPQGGTWIYARAGWCPGIASDLAEYDITANVTAGQRTTFNYGLQTASGNSNYVVSSQIVSYGAINHNLDASVVEIMQPSKRIEFLRNNSICSQPKVVIQNTGKTKLTSLSIEYWINNDADHQTFTWKGNLDFLAKEIVTLPSPTELWNGINKKTDNKFHIKIKQPNGSTDEYIHNNTSVSNFDVPPVFPSKFYIQFQTNSAASESKYELLDENGKPLFTRDGMSNSTIYKDSFKLNPGCYSILITDKDNDGISFYANRDGSGFASIRRIDRRGLLHSFQNNFGASIRLNFTVDYPLSYDELILKNSDIKLYPNPAGLEFKLVAPDIKEANTRLFDILGREIDIPSYITKNEITFMAKKLSAGVYFLSIEFKGKRYNKKVIIQ